MKQLFVAVLASLLISVAGATDDPVYQRYIQTMAKGSTSGIKDVAQSIYNTGVKDQEVLDVAMEVLLQNYRGASSYELDALAWLAKAIGQSENNRYSNGLKEVLDGESHKKIKKYANRAWKDVGKSPKVEQYVKGSVNLEALRGKQSTAKAKPAPKKAAARGKATIEDIREGMRMQEVYDLIGYPTDTISHQTGKAWIPFNFGGKDLARTVALYKGKGRVIFSHSAYEGQGKVLEVIVDPAETGVP